MNRTSTFAELTTIYGMYETLKSRKRNENSHDMSTKVNIKKENELEKMKLGTRINWKPDD